MNAREIALTALNSCRTEGAWADAAIKKAIKVGKCSPQDASLSTRIFYSTVQNRLLLDFYIGHFLKGKLKNLQPVVLDILRLSVVQILYFDRIPDSAVVDEAVEMTKKRANGKASGLVNAVLRSIIRSKDSLPETKDYSIKYSCPQELLQLIKRSVGPKELEPFLIAQNDSVPITVRINRLKTTPEELIRKLEKEHVTAELHPFCPECLNLTGTGNISNLKAFTEGLFYVQDAASVLSGYALEVGRNMKVLDCCSAPGGKSFSAAMNMGNTGSIISCDIHEHKIPLIYAGAQRLGITNLTAMVKDASLDCEIWHDYFDRVICDVPCSGLGVIRKKPDIRWKQLQDIEKLPVLQLKILETQSRFLKKNGILVYSTCTIVPEENEKVVEAFLKDHTDFIREPFKLPFEGGERGDVTLYPHKHKTDGFYICRLKRIR